MIGIKAACAVVGRSRATYYRGHRTSPSPPRPTRPPTRQPRALDAAEQDQVRQVLHSERFVDQAPASVYATLLDEGRYLCSVPSMYRLLRADGEVHERRRQARHPAVIKPEPGGQSAESGLVLGYHQAARSGQVDLLLPVCHR